MGLGLLVAAPRSVARRAGPDRDGWELPLAPVEVPAALALGALPGAEEQECAACHTAIVDEWSRTQHAHAWINEPFQDSIAKKRRPESCTGCHVPEPLLQGDPDRFGRKPRPRPIDGSPEAIEDASEPRVHGVSCASCHAGPDGVMHGPFDDATSPAHASVADERFRGSGSDALCLACHQTTVGPVIGIGKDYALSDLSERGMSCVACHMRPVERPIAVDPDGVLTYPARPGRSHLLQSPRDPRFLRAGFGRRAARSDGRVTVHITNLAGHRVPGLVERRFVFRATGLDADGATVSEAELVVDTRAYLPLEGGAEIRLEGEAASVRLTAEHHAPGAAAPVPFLDEVLTVE